VNRGHADAKPALRDRLSLRRIDARSQPQPTNVIPFPKERIVRRRRMRE
jgi:hypothetical protein